MTKERTGIDSAMPDAEQTSSSGQASGGVLNLILEVVKEMREQRNDLKREHQQAAIERKRERRWKMAFQGVFFGAPLILGVLYFLFFLNSAGVRWGPWGDVVGVVRIEGKIDSSSIASAEKIIPALEKAFTTTSVKAVVLSVDSPGGAPVEAERIYTALDTLKQKHPKPVVAVINNLGASAAYMIAIHADKIYAGKYSLVGSIGMIMAPWELDRAIGKLDVKQRVYASGKLKAFLNPFTPVTAEADSKARQMVNQLGQVFVEEVKVSRGNVLKVGVDYGTGEVWGGIEAKEFGLVDAIGTLDEVVSSTWCLKTYDFGPVQQGLGFMRSSFAASVGAAIENWLWRDSLQLR